jgi:hypothetical protein
MWKAIVKDPAQAGGNVLAAFFGSMAHDHNDRLVCPWVSQLHYEPFATYVQVVASDVMSLFTNRQVREALRVLITNGSDRQTCVI